MTVRTFQKKTKVIDDVEYSVVEFPAGPGFQLLFRLKNAVGDSLGSLLGGEVGTVISMIGHNLTEAQFLELVLDLLEFTYPEGHTVSMNKDLFNTHFAGRYGHLMKVVAFVLEVNYADFLDELKLVVTTGINQLVGMMDKLGATANPLTVQHLQSQKT